MLLKKHKKALSIFILFILIILSVVPVLAVENNDDTTTETTENAESDKPLYTPRLTAPDRSNPYYYSDSNPFFASGYGMPNCTAYAWGRAYEILGSPPALPTSDARKWYERTTAYPKGQTPALGAVAVWWSDVSGHVAVVEKIENGTVTFSNSAWGGTTFYLTTSPADGSDNYCGNRAGWTFLGFIYIADFGGSAGGSIQEVSLNDKIDDQLNGIINYVNDQWTGLGTDIDKAISMSDAIELSQIYKNLFLFLANFVIAIVFSISIIEDFTMGIEINFNIILNLIVPVIYAKVFVDFSYTAVGIIVGFFGQFMQGVGVGFDEVLTNFETNFISTVTPENIFLAFLNSLPIYLVCLIAFCVAIIMLIKIYITSLSMACLVLFAPPFFACLAGRPGKHIFESYIRALISTGLNIIYMFMVITLGSIWLNNVSIAWGNTWFFENIVKAVIIMAMGFMFIKAPRAITNLI